MISLLNKLCVVVLAGMMSSVALGNAGPTTAPMTAGTVPGNAGAKPVPRVEVFAFTAVSNPGQNDWTGRGIQENLQSDVSRTGATLILPPHPPAANEDPVAFAKENHADLAVSGTYQVVGNQIRVNGHVTDVATDTTVGGFAATGNQQDLFKVEDALGEQLRALLPGSMTAQQIREAFEQPPQVVYSETTPIYTPPATVNNYYDTQPGPNYYYPDYDYYPYDYGFYGGLGLGFYPGFYGHDRGGDFHGRYDGYRGFGNRLTPNPTFNNPAYRASPGVGRPSFGGGFRGGFGGGFHGGGGGGHR